MFQSCLFALKSSQLPKHKEGLFSIHSVSNFVSIALVKALPIGTSAPTVRSYTHSYTVLASGARVGARVEVKKNDLGKVSRFFFLQVSNRFKAWFSAVVHSDFSNLAD